MKSMKEVFDLPVSPDDFSDAFYPNEDNQDEYAAHAINCHDELVCALAEAQSILAHCKADAGYSSSQKRAAIQINDALLKARGEI